MVIGGEQSGEKRDKRGRAMGEQDGPLTWVGTGIGLKNKNAEFGRQNKSRMGEMKMGSCLRWREKESDGHRSKCFLSRKSANRGRGHAHSHRWWVRKKPSTCGGNGRAKRLRRVRKPGGERTQASGNVQMSEK